MARIKKAQFGERVGRSGGRSCGIEKQIRKDERQAARENRQAIDKLDVKSVKMLVKLLSLLSLNYVVVVVHLLGKERKVKILLVD